MEKILAALKLKHDVGEVVVPFVRSSFARLNRQLPPAMPIQEARQIQVYVTETLKKANLKSQLPASKDQALWALPHRSAEKRNRIKAIITIKEFLLKWAKANGKSV